MAADPDWRSEFVSNLSDDFASDFSAATRFSSPNSPPRNRNDDDYDLETVDKMLSEINRPGPHANVK